VDEKVFIRGIERFDAAEFADALLSAGPEETRALRARLGPDAFERMRERAAEARMRSGARGNVVVLHGIMGGELTEYETDAQPRAVWLKLLRILCGGFSLLPLAGGASVRRIAATGILKRYYGELLLSLMAQGWNTHAYWFDWRLDVRESARTLALRIREWFKPGEHVHLVAHSMGGLVARMFIRHHPQLWRAMWDAKGNGARGGRLVMLGTPNHGSFAVPQMLFGLNDNLRKLALLDLFHSLRELIEVAKTFTGIYQMLPSPLRMPGAEPLYSSATFSPVSVDQAQLDAARAFHEELASDASTSDPSRLVYIAGCRQPTYSGVRDWQRLDSFDGYEATRLGDGTVPHSLGLLDGVPAYYAEAEHGALPCDKAVMPALDEILAAGSTTRLASAPPQTRLDDEEAVREELALQREAEEAAVRELTRQLEASARRPGGEDSEEAAAALRRAEDLLMRGFACAAEPRSWAAPEGSPAACAVASAAAVSNTLRMRLSRSSIADVEPGEPPVDAVAVGHYIGVRPAGAELALDEAISAPLGGAKLLTTFAERGILRGEAGQPFFLADPRDTGRLIAVAGLGYPGRCGAPELAMAIRELVWSLSALGKRHLAAVLIGSGEGNLSTREAVAAWIDGIRAALAEPRAGSGRLATITLVETDACKLLEMRRALAAIEPEPVAGVTLEVTGPPEEELIEPAAAEAAARARAAVLAKSEGWEEQINSAYPTRLTVDMEGHVYRYGAVTRTASVPERCIALDPGLVQEANNALAAACDAAEQWRLGQYLLKLLFPADLRNELSTAHPLVVTCDSSAARVPWEMIAQPGAGTPAGAFLGIHRGLTRQLRTPFAPPPEPFPAASRVLRVLIVADGACDARLPGAAREGELVRELFSRFREQELAKPAPARRAAEVEICALIGPEQATRTRVMQELLLREYDILHYAGHCAYDAEHPTESGWVFSGSTRLTANELSRVDRVPAFVFANACESGVTPDRAGSRSPGMAPSFAESFFARGVRDFICTGWPVNDDAALEFARTFYTCLLGLDGRAPQPAHAAMREARARIFNLANGIASWGAYQHYGNPYTRVVAAAGASAADR
jgi:pimeloyl-ACP methyl ester carboxylesterase